MVIKKLFFTTAELSAKLNKITFLNNTGKRQSTTISNANWIRNDTEQRVT